MLQRTSCSIALPCSVDSVAISTRSRMTNWIMPLQRAATRITKFWFGVRSFRKEWRSSTYCESMTSAADPDPIPISALQHAVYCLRQAALIHIERVWAENRLTAEGRVLHDVAHEAGERKGRRGVRRVTALPLACRRLNIVGVADLVEFRAEADGETAFPIEYKRGKAKLDRADEVQLCAQA